MEDNNENNSINPSNGVGSDEWLNGKDEFICSSRWCKCMYIDYRYLWFSDGIKTCPKCRSFNGELSGGVTFTKKEYSGERNDGRAHQTEFKFSDYTKGKWGKFWGK